MHTSSDTTSNCKNNLILIYTVNNQYIIINKNYEYVHFSLIQYICDQIGQNRLTQFKPSDKAHISLTLNCYTNELMIHADHACFIANDLLVCFSWGFFLRPV